MAIIAVLASLLFPSLATAREKARRTSCLNNLKQFSTALENYTSDYSGYFPSWAGWFGFDWCDGAGRACGHTHNATGGDANTVYQQPTVKSRMLYGGRPGDVPINATVAETSQWRCVGVGYKGDRSPYAATTDFSDGQLNCAPNGLGYLLTCGYIGDGRLYYCPSSDGMLGDYAAASAQRSAYRLGHWKDAGGFDAKALMYGKWTGCNNSTVLRVYSHYMYRDVPLFMFNVWHVYQDGSYRIPGVKPDVGARIGQPLFRTSKELGARAVVTDAWSKTDSLGYDKSGRAAVPGRPVAESMTWVGAGAYGHKEGYNVLYGGGHASWYGDPPGRIIWHRQGRATLVTTSSVYNCLNSNYFYGQSGPFDQSLDIENDFYCANTSLAIWHDFDVSAGVDVGAK